MKTMIRYFVQRHVLVNLITALIFVGGIIAWNVTNKEELPDITFNTVRISTSYSGASAEDVEFYVTDPLEEALQGIDHVVRITSSSSPGSSSIAVELDREVPDIDKLVTEIQSQVASVRLPEDIVDEPRVRMFETTKKAIIDIAIYNTSAPLLSVDQRLELQNLVRGLETKLLSQPDIFELNRSGYLSEEININADPKKFIAYDVPLTSISSAVQQNHIRAPSGTLKSGAFEQVTVLSELNRKEVLDELVVQGGFDSQPVTLKSIADISDGFEDQRTIFKVNGYEAILLNVVKNSSHGILEALDTVKKVTAQYQETVLNDTPFEIAFLDDESVDVRNRLAIISSNGLLGFALIVFCLFIFLNKRSGIWVALGIPLSLCFTLILGHLMGYTINGVTLAGIIIVLGIVVDDAIIVAENISRKLNEGVPLVKAAVEGTQEVAAPIIASVLTTCVAFIPLFFFSGRFGNFVTFIPPMIFLMLFASLLESFFLLPSHMTLFPGKTGASPAKKWFDKWESIYESFLRKVLPKRYLVVSLFIVLIVLTGLLTRHHFKFVMFPDEESREVVVSGIVTDAKSARQTALGVQPIEDYLRRYLGKEAVGIRSEVARGRRGDSADENQFRITLEIVSKEKRKKSADTLINEIETFTKSVPGVSEIRFRKSRFGQSSGSVFEIVVQESDDIRRESLVSSLVDALSTHPDVSNPEADVIPLQEEYIISFDQKELKRLSVNPSTISSTLRTILNGSQMYTLLRNDEEVDVYLTVNDDYRKQINDVLKVPVANTQGYLVPLEDLVDVQEVQAKKSIRRMDQKRTSYVYADLNPDSKRSPLEVAEELESSLFPELLVGYPTAQLSFEGEIKDTRESKSELELGVLTAIGLIYVILAVLFDSFVKPFRIMLVLPFGVIGVILAFYLHGKVLFGFYAAIGTLGMLGVVVNDAIVMLDKLDRSEGDTASVAKTRLRAILLTTFTTVAGVMPTAYGIGGTDVMLGDMMLAMAWGLLFGTLITLVLTPCVFLIERDFSERGKALIRDKFFVVLVAAGVCIVGFNTPLKAAERVVPLDEFIQSAMEKDTAFQSILYENFALRYDYDLAVELPELTLSLDSDYEVYDPSSSNYVSVGLTQTYPSLGQTFSVDLTQSTDSSQSATFGFSQDIAKNAFGKAVRLDQRIQGLKTEIATYQLVEAYEDYTAELMELYYSWIRQFESAQLAEATYQENNKVLKSIQDRQKKKIADQTDVNKLKFQTLARQEQLMEYQQTYMETTTLIKRVLALPDSEEIRPDTEIALDALPGQLSHVLSDVRSHSRTFQVLDQLAVQKDLEVDRLARELLPSVELSAFVEIDDASDTSGEVSVSFDLPLYRRRANAAKEDAVVASKKTKTDNISVETQLFADLTNLHASLTVQKAKINIASQKLTLAKEILDAESENYSYGKISLNDYITAVNRYDSARFDEIDRKITYQRLSVEWKRLTDRLVDNIQSEAF